MLQETSRIELALWFAHVTMGSLDDEATDLRVAILASQIRNGPHFMKEGKQPFTVQDFLPKRERPDVGAQIKAFLLPKMKKEP